MSISTMVLGFRLVRRLDQDTHVPLAPVRGDADDPLSLPELARLRPRGDEDRAGRWAEEEADVASELADGLMGLPPRDRIDLVDEIAAQERRYEPRADPRDPVGAGFPARHDRRFGGLDGHGAALRVPF